MPASSARTKSPIEDPGCNNLLAANNRLMQLDRFSHRYAYNPVAFQPLCRRILVLAGELFGELKELEDQPVEILIDRKFVGKRLENRRQAGGFLP